MKKRATNNPTFTPRTLFKPLRLTKGKVLVGFRNTNKKWVDWMEKTKTNGVTRFNPVFL